jgi:hypothetical protein
MTYEHNVHAIAIRQNKVLSQYVHYENLKKYIQQEKEEGSNILRISKDY